MTKKEKILAAYPDDTFLFWEGFEEAILGVDYTSLRIIYSIKKCIDILIEDSKLSFEDAREDLEYNTLGAYVGEKTPIMLDDDFLDEDV